MGSGWPSPVRVGPQGPAWPFRRRSDGPAGPRHPGCRRPAGRAGRSRAIEGDRTDTSGTRVTIGSEGQLGVKATRRQWRPRGQGGRRDQRCQGRQRPVGWLSATPWLTTRVSRLGSRRAVGTARQQRRQRCRGVKGDKGDDGTDGADGAKGDKGDRIRGTSATTVEATSDWLLHNGDERPLDGDHGTGTERWQGRRVTATDGVERQRTVSKGSDGANGADGKGGGNGHWFDRRVPRTTDDHHASRSSISRLSCKAATRFVRPDRVHPEGHERSSASRPSWPTSTSRPTVARSPGQPDQSRLGLHNVRSPRSSVQHGPSSPLQRSQPERGVRAGRHRRLSSNHSGVVLRSTRSRDQGGVGFGWPRRAVPRTVRRRRKVAVTPA